MSLQIFAQKASHWGEGQEKYTEQLWLELLQT